MQEIASVGLVKFKNFPGSMPPDPPSKHVANCHMLCVHTMHKTLSRLLIYNLAPTFKSNDNPALFILQNFAFTLFPFTPGTCSGPK